MIAANPTDGFTVGLALGVGFGALGALMCTLPFYFVTELFPTPIRNTATGISFNVGFALFGGCAPILAQVSAQFHPLGPGILYSLGGAVTLTSALLGLLLQRSNLVTLAHIRKEPYFRTTCKSTCKETELCDAAPKSESSDVSELAESQSKTPCGCV